LQHMHSSLPSFPGWFHQITNEIAMAKLSPSKRLRGRMGLDSTFPLPPVFSTLRRFFSIGTPKTSTWNKAKTKVPLGTPNEEHRFWWQKHVHTTVDTLEGHEKDFESALEQLRHFGNFAIWSDGMINSLTDDQRRVLTFNRQPAEIILEVISLWSQWFASNLPVETQVHWNLTKIALVAIAYLHFRNPKNGSRGASVPEDSVLGQVMNDMKSKLGSSWRSRSKVLYHSMASPKSRQHSHTASCPWLSRTLWTSTIFCLKIGALQQIRDPRRLWVHVENVRPHVSNRVKQFFFFFWTITTWELHPPVHLRSPEKRTLMIGVWSRWFVAILIRPSWSSGVFFLRDLIGILSSLEKHRYCKPRDNHPDPPPPLLLRPPLWRPLRKRHSRVKENGWTNDNALVRGMCLAIRRRGIPYSWFWTFTRRNYTAKTSIRSISTHKSRHIVHSALSGKAVLPQSPPQKAGMILR
jgi:hypothetical protein